MRPSRRPSISTRSTRARDIVLHSATKFLTGNHAALLGATVTRDPDRTARLREYRGNAGIVSAPDAAEALSRGLETLDERMARHTETATELARRLEEHPSVSTVRYPGFSGLISFDVEDPRAVETSTQADPERNEPGRRPLDDGEPPPLGGRPDPARACCAFRPGSRTSRRSGATSIRH